MSRKTLIVFLFAALVAAPVARASGHGHGEEHATVAEHSEHESAHAVESTAPSEAGAKKQPGFFAVMLHGFSQIIAESMAKVDELRTLDENFEKMKTQVVKLEVENEELKERLTAKKESHRAEVIKKHAKEESGVESGRTIASLEVADKTLLSKPPGMIFKGALAAFEQGDYETAAKAFTVLINNEENATYQTAQVAYLTGVSLYHVGNYKSAATYFEKLTGGAFEKAGSSYAPRAMTWLSLCRSMVGDRAGARAIASELVQKYPKSREARRLNRNENFR